MEGYYHGQRLTTWFLWEEGVKPSDIDNLLSAVCEEKAPAWCSPAFNWVWSFDNGRNCTGSCAYT
jgi:hypothetical protein